jgi:fido (protein-threonine AMPylation protein)
MPNEGQQRSNKRGYQTLEELNKFERAETAYRALELEFKPLKGNFTYEHLKTIHKHLFALIRAISRNKTTVTKEK